MVTGPDGDGLVGLLWQDTKPRTSAEAVINATWRRDPYTYRSFSALPPTQEFSNLSQTGRFRGHSLVAPMSLNEVQRLGQWAEQRHLEELRRRRMDRDRAMRGKKHRQLLLRTERDRSDRRVGAGRLRREQVGVLRNRGINGEREIVAVKYRLICETPFRMSALIPGLTAC